MKKLWFVVVLITMVSSLLYAKPRVKKLAEVKEEFAHVCDEYLGSALEDLVKLHVKAGEERAEEQRRKILLQAHELAKQIQEAYTLLSDFVKDDGQYTRAQLEDMTEKIKVKKDLINNGAAVNKHAAAVKA